ncbi:hypothetical protein JVT61DRAFT_3547 [Boletus reticuloceps]|uniref:Uncharacterized protein n=1 Tax=Boletus reticuloceps TaxID=495285 RepID=A0A8I3AAB8_9AGAM|nr:hypothetical protein JVT61DRAFT_3547 [Boletus reticuloceps]
MESLPVDMSNPPCKTFSPSFVLTPLSLSVNIATVLVCHFIVKPSILDIIKLYPASISPHPAWLAVYVILIYIFQIGYCLLLILAKDPDTKRALVKAVGLSLVLANWAMAVWAIAWILRMFLFSTIMLGILLLLLVYSNVALLIYHAPTYSRPFDMALIHAPLRFFMILPLSLLFPYSLFITLGLTYASHPEDYALHPWPGFAVVMSVNLLSLVVILFRRDIIWAIAATWICISIWTASPKPAPVFITVVLFTVLHPLGLISMLIYDQLSHRRGRIALPPDDAPVSRRSRRDQRAPSPQPHGLGSRQERPDGAREVDVEGVWGT